MEDDRIEQLEEALRLYADPENHKQTMIAGTEMISRIEFDGGQLARDVLGVKTESKGIIKHGISVV